MKRATIAFVTGLLVSFALMITYVALSPDFQPPIQLQQETLKPDHPIWEMGMDDLAAYLYEEGVITTLDYDLLSEGIADDARVYGDLEIYWWDVDALKEGSEEFRSYQEACKDGTIDLWGSGNLMQVQVHGPFAICTISYTGDAQRLSEVFSQFCMD